MNARLPIIAAATADQTVNQEVPAPPLSCLRLFGAIAGKLLLVTAGLAVGAFIGLIVALFSGLAVIAC